MSGDYEAIPGGGIRLIKPAADSEGHKVALITWGKCPRCKQMTTVFRCGDVHCTGARASDHHVAAECDTYLAENSGRPGWGHN